MNKLFVSVPLSELLTDAHAEADTEMYELLAETPYILEGTSVTASLPYARANDLYEGHLAACSACQAAVWYDGCPVGNRLATLAADAMGAQGDLASQN
jgi:hypothetical protein